MANRWILILDMISFKKKIVLKIPRGGGGGVQVARGLYGEFRICPVWADAYVKWLS